MNMQSQEDFALALGVSRSAVRDWEAGRCAPRLSNMEKKLYDYAYSKPHGSGSITQFKVIKEALVQHKTDRVNARQLRID